MPIGFREKALIGVVLVALVAGGSAAFLWLTQPRLESELVIYGPRGISVLANRLADEFNKTYGVKVTFQNFGGAVETANRLINEKASPQADLFIGLPEFYAKPVIDSGALDRYEPPNINDIPSAKRWEQGGYVTPLDEGYITILYNQTIVSQMGLPIPAALDDLLRPEYRGLVIYPNPTTSGTGLAFLMWVLTVKGEEPGFQFLMQLKGNIASTGYPGGWTASVTALQRGEAAVAIMWNTDAGYEGTPDLRVAATTGYAYREGIALVHGAKHPEAAKKFIEFVLTEAAQRIVAMNDTGVYPVRPGVATSYPQTVIVPTTVVGYNQTLGVKVDEWKQRWQREVAAG